MMTDPREMESPDVRWLAEHDFTQEEIAALLHLRHQYQNGRSDRAPIARYWRYLRWLVVFRSMEA